MRHACTTTLFAFLCSSLLWAQDPYYISINKSKGLPSNSVYDVFQDSKGFMWFATDEGLCKFDGKNFKTYTSPVLTSRSGTCIKEDKFGRIWYMNFDNKVYYIENEELKDIPQHKPHGTFSRFHVMENWLLIPQHDGIDVFDLRTMKLHQTLTLHDYLYSCGSGNTFFYQDAFKDVYRIDTTLKPVGIGHNNLLLTACDHEVAFLNDKSNNSKGYTTVNNKGEKRDVHFDFNEYLMNISFTKEFQWICTKNGCFKKQLRGKESVQHVLLGKPISNIVQDKDNNYWIGTTTEGVLFVPSVNNCFFTFAVVPQHLQVYDDHLLFGGKSNCLYDFDLITHELKETFRKDNNHEVTAFLYDPVTKKTMLSSDQLYELVDGKVKFSVPLAVKDIAKIDNKYFSVPASGVCGFYQTTDNNQFSQWDALQQTHRSNSMDREQLSSLVSSVRGKSSCYDSKKNLVYMVSNGGMFVASTKTVKEIQHNGKTIQARRIRYYNGDVIVLQNNGIILHLDENQKITEHPLMIGDEMVAVNKIVLRKNWLFLITNGKGLFVMNLDDPGGSIRNITEVSNNEDVNDIEVWNGKYLIACSGGLLMVDINRPESTQPVPILILNEIRVNNQPVAIKPGQKFKYYQNNIHISYSILSYNANLTYPLYYRINDGDWKLTPPETRALDFPSLKRGDYKIEFRLGNTDQYPIQTLEFSINRPVWRIVWFWVGAIAIIALIFYCILKWRTSLLNKKVEDLQKQLTKERNLNKLKKS
jgi:hypothetical protein